MYKVIWLEEEDVVYASDILAGMYAMIDIIFVSSNFDDLPLAIAAFLAREHGIIVAGSASDDDPWLTTQHHDISWLLTIVTGIVDTQMFASTVYYNDTSIVGITTFGLST